MPEGTLSMEEETAFEVTRKAWAAVCYYCRRLLKYIQCGFNKAKDEFLITFVSTLLHSTLLDSFPSATHLVAFLCTFSHSFVYVDRFEHKY